MHDASAQLGSLQPCTHPVSSGWPRVGGHCPVGTMAGGTSAAAPAANACIDDVAITKSSMEDATIAEPLSLQPSPGGREARVRCAAGAHRSAASAWLTPFPRRRYKDPNIDGGLNLRVLAPVNCSLRTDSQNMQSQIY